MDAKDATAAPASAPIVEGEWEDQGTRRTLTPEQLRQFHTLAGIRVPLQYIAALFDMSQDTLERIMKKDDKVRAVFDKGRAQAGTNARQTLYMLAVGEKDPKTGKYTREPDLNALKFWCGTQEGMSTKHTLELQRGGPSPEEMDPHARRAEIERLASQRALTTSAADNQVL